MNERDKELVKQAELMRKYNYAYSKELQEFVSLTRADERKIKPLPGTYWVGNTLKDKK